MIEKKDVRTELIDKIARVLVENDAGWIAKAYLEAFKPISTMGGVMMYVPAFPFFEILGTWGHELGLMLVDDPKGNIDRLLKRIDELEAERAKAKEALGEKGRRKRGVLSSFRERFKREPRVKGLR